mmetsp:Transcript_31307/g.68412  ORF Transcript_31307/g.68412 Transcript_31307/m.68412 type:complete len:251 (+) Transcript_31307:1092-1844(+)
MWLSWWNLTASPRSSKECSACFTSLAYVATIVSVSNWGRVPVPLRTPAMHSCRAASARSSAPKMPSADWWMHSFSPWMSFAASRSTLSSSLFDAAFWRLARILKVFLVASSEAEMLTWTCSMLLLRSMRGVISGSPVSARDSSRNLDRKLVLRSVTLIFSSTRPLFSSASRCIIWSDFAMARRSIFASRRYVEIKDIMLLERHRKAAFTASASKGRILSSRNLFISSTSSSSSLSPPTGAISFARLPGGG